MLSFSNVATILLFLWSGSIAIGQTLEDSKKLFIETLHRVPYEYTPLPAGITRKPALIYYAIDTKELFMQVAVDREVKSIMQHCDTDVGQNWAILLNSWFTHRNSQLLVCKNGVFKEINLSTYDGPRYQRILNKIAKLTNSDISPETLNKEFRFPVTTAKGTLDHRKLYKKYPFANADVMYEVLSILEGPDFFPTTEFMKFMHFKAHALVAPDGAEIVLGALDKKLTEYKNSAQYADWKAAATDTDKDFVLPAWGNAGYFHSISDETLAALNLGRVSEIADNHKIFLNSNQKKLLGLGQYGVATNIEFGMSRLPFEAALNALSNDVTLSESDGRAIALVILEACGANLTPVHFDNGVLARNPHIHTTYSQSYTLWYRNFNWEDVLSNRELVSNSNKLYANLLFKLGMIKAYDIEAEQ